MTDADIDAILRGGRSRKRWLLLFAAIAAIGAAAVAAFVLTRPEEANVAIEPQRAEAFMGRLSTEVELSGSALPERSATLSFDIGGVVASIAVAMGDEVMAGEALAKLEDSDARRRVETARVQLRQAQLRLDNLLAAPEESAIASANQAIASAKSQVTSAERDLALLVEPPSDADLAGAEQAIASAESQIASAERDLARLAEPPSDADLASAEQAVATALGQISSAEQDLALLAEPPSEADLARAEQAIATALGQISSTEEALADLYTGPTEAELAESRSAVTQASIRLSDATRLDEELREVLTEAFDTFCERFSGLIRSVEIIKETCDSILPLSDAQMTALAESFEDRSITYENLGNSLIDANVEFVAAAADLDTALSGLTSAEENLAEMLRPISEEDVYQAEQALATAEASHAAAVAGLEELQTLPGEDDVYQARQAVEAAKASHAAAVARLADLQEAAGEEDVYQAEQALDAAMASHAAAVARIEDLRAPADEGDIERARASLESAQAGLTSAQAQYDDLVAGPTENAIEQQRQDVRLAELSVEEALAALADLTVSAPFDGVIEAVNVQPGDRISSGLAAFTLNTSNRMMIALTVTEEDLLDLETGQTGTASFDAIDGIEYPVRVESISRVPDTEQGVVTYDVEARILAGAEQASGGNARAGGGFGGGAAPGPLAGVRLPEGVTAQQVRQAILDGEPLPEGVVLPERLQALVASGAAQRFLQSGGIGQGPAAPQETAGQPGAVASRPVPAPGMSASVTILVEIREESVLLPVSALRQLDGDWFVSVPYPSLDETGGETGEAFERVFVEVGQSDGQNIEIESGIDAGAVVLIGADNAGIAFSATQQQPQGFPGFGPGQGGFGPPGGPR